MKNFVYFCFCLHTFKLDFRPNQVPLQNNGRHTEVYGTYCKLSLSCGYDTIATGDGHLHLT